MTIVVPIFDIDGNQTGVELLEYEVTEKELTHSEKPNFYYTYHLDCNKPSVAHTDDVYACLESEFGHIKLNYI
jgi:hypothetical protein